MKRPWHVAIIFGLAMAVVLTVMGWVSTTLMRLDRAQAEAIREAALEENVRLALWRMDSAVAPLIAQESARPWTEYGSAAPQTTPSPHVLLHFEIGQDQGVHSPELYAQPMARKAPQAEAELSAAARRLEILQTSLAGVALASQLPAVASQPAFPIRQSLPGQQAAIPQQQLDSIGPQLQQQRSQTEYNVRMDNTVANQFPADALASGANASIGLLKPVWLADKLLLARRVRIGGRQFVQGAWINWETLRADLVAGITDLLPGAALTAVASGLPGPEARMLASLPVKLIPGELPFSSNAPASALRVSLTVAWACVVLAGLAVGVLLLAAVTLSERRAAFVSAVTHELRTPLTTLRMYAEMLVDGMVVGEAKRGAYLQTMRAEADRLGHLVENVLAYSRLERGRARGHVEALPVGRVIERIVPRLRERAEQAGMTLVVESVSSCIVRVDVSAVEQILFNLVDNACKYAATAADRRIHLDAVDEETTGGIRVRDYGPGIDAGQRRRLFCAFSKSSSDAANSAPGVGLGLALSRRLAREMGGDLRLLNGLGDGGAAFLLTLPEVGAPSRSTPGRA